MPNEKIFVSFVYKNNNKFVLIVPDIPNSMIVAKTQSEVINKAIRNLRQNFKDEIENISPNSIEYFMNKYKNKYIPNDAILYPLPIKIGKRVKKFKRITTSMDEELVEQIDAFSKKNNMKKSEFFAQASREFMQKF